MRVRVGVRARVRVRVEVRVEGQAQGSREKPKRRRAASHSPGSSRDTSGSPSAAARAASSSGGGDGGGTGYGLAQGCWELRDGRETIYSRRGARGLGRNLRWSSAPPTAPATALTCLRHRRLPSSPAAPGATRRGSGASETGRIRRGGTSSCCASPPSADNGRDVEQPQQLSSPKPRNLSSSWQHDAKTGTVDQKGR